MEPRRKREIALAVVSAMIVAVAVYRIRSSASSAVGAGGVQSGTAKAANAQQPNGQITELDLDSLHSPRPEPVDTTRNPFRFKPKPAPPPPPAPPRPPVVAQPIDPTAPPPPARISMKFIGIVESKPSGRLAVLSDGRGVYYGRENDTIEGRYRILRIGVESLDLAYIDGRGRQTIRLTGQ